MTNVVNAIYALVPKANFNTSGGKIFWYDSRPQPTEQEIENKLAELQSAEPMRLLRQQRDQLLSQTDWRMTTDYPYSDQSAWATYRTELRDLPSTAEPALDEQGNLTNVVWPTPPDDV